MTKGLPFMQYYPADFIGGTLHLSCEEIGAYWLLLNHYWLKGGLPNNDAQLAHICRITPRKWALIKGVMADFFGPEWVHERADREKEKAHLKSLKRATSGEAGGIAKSLKTKEAALANATILAEQKAADALASSIESRTVEKESATLPLLISIPSESHPKPRASGYSQEFESAWELYERKGTKKPAWAKWKALKPADRAAAIDGISIYFEEAPEAIYRKDFERYLSTRLWERYTGRPAAIAAAPNPDDDVLVSLPKSHAAAKTAWVLSGNYTTDFPEASDPLMLPRGVVTQAMKTLTP